MNIIEASNFFVRVTCFDFKNRDENIKLQFRIIPMIHIGSKAYYEEALNYLKECDEIIYEGVSFGKARLRFNLYKSVANQVNLVTQSEYLDLRNLSAKLIHADFTEELAEAEWGKLKFREKMILRLLLPIQLLYESLTLNRERLAKQFMHSQEEMYLAYGPREDEQGTASNFINDAREQIIFKTINQKIEMDSDKEKLIGILYGAGHMKKICRFLIDKLGYVPYNGQFLKVFTV